MLFGLDFFQVEISVRKNRERHKKAVTFPVAILTGDGSDRA